MGATPFLERWLAIMDSDEPARVLDPAGRQRRDPRARFCSRVRSHSKGKPPRHLTWQLH